MKLIEYFSIWLDALNERPILFYSLIIITLSFLGFIIFFAKSQKQKTYGKRDSPIKTLDNGRKKKYIVDKNYPNKKLIEKNYSSSFNEDQSNKPVMKKSVTPITKPIDKPKSVEIDKTTDHSSETTLKSQRIEQSITIPQIENVTTENEEQSTEKYIGYNPINFFAQTEPLNFPYVIMPKVNSVIKFPRKGRVGRKGFKEESFKVLVDKYFKSEFQVFDDRFIMTKNCSNPYEPDFTLTNEKNDIYIFLDIEIDEPYEGLNDITKRKASHFQYADTNRNNAFVNRGWLVIRFAEIQIHLNPDACCRFVADVIKSINPQFLIPAALNHTTIIQPIKQWTKDEAEEWSRQRYREQYLGIVNFGTTSESQLIENIEETELGAKIEEKVIETPITITSISTNENSSNLKLNLVIKAISSNKYLSFIYKGRPTITKPIKVTEIQLKAFCYVKNIEQDFNINEISNLLLKSNYNILRISGPRIGLSQIANVVNTAIIYKRYIRMKYTRAAWNNYIINEDTGEIILDIIEAEESIRTIMNVQLSINSLPESHILTYNLNSNYITAFCNKRNEQRTFRFDRIGEIEILDI